VTDGENVYTFFSESDKPMSLMPTIPVRYGRGLFHVTPHRVGLRV